MTDPKTEEKTEEKSQAQLDYEQGLEFLKNKETSLAANMFHNAFIGFEQENNEHGIANASDKLGDICVEQGNYDKALSHYDKAYAICEKETDRFSLLSLEKKKANIFFKAERFQEAVDIYLDILDEYQFLKSPKGAVEIIEILADVYIAMGEKEKAADSYRLAASIHKNFKHKRHAEEFLQKAENALIS